MKKFNLKKQNNTQKPKRKINKIRLWIIITYSFIAVGLISLVIGLGVIFSITAKRPELNTEDFISEQSSQIFDKNGDLVAEIGSVKRENISYDDIPNELVDAFIAVEDSRFFSHPGFDISRFTKSMLENIKSMSFAQGGSTFTMQLTKYTYFMDDNAGVGASKSIDRKVQEISLALDLEKQINKKTIFELYLNKINFGGSGNIRGVQKAAQYYFGKDVSELNLAECALLAGVINAPNAYNPHNNLELATQRRNTVLYLMNYHGYISDDEYELTKNIKVEDLLTTNTKKGHAGDGAPYQAYIDEVIKETIRLTGYDPTVTPMKIYTAMDKDVQTLMDKIQAGDVNGYFEYPDELFELASVSLNNHTGEINGILGGRSYSYGGALLLNHATDQYNQPGSTVKPFLDYALAFENLGWATSHVVLDKPLMWAGTDVVVANANGKYAGEITLKDAVGNSLNTPAIQTMQEIIDTKTSAYVVDYMHKLGFNRVNTNDFNVQYSIGGSTFQASVLELASAQSTMLNGGVHVTPHTVRRIEFMNGRDPITPEIESQTALSEEAAYLVSELLYNNVYGPYANLMQILRDDYPVYAKTGTTDWGKSGKPYGIPVGAAKDGWMIGSTSDYTIATWIGYEKAIKDKNTYLSNNKYLLNIQGKVTNLLIDENVKTNGVPSKLNKPSGIVNISHILGTFPYVSPIAGMDEKFIATGLIKKDAAKLVDPQEISIEQINDSFDAKINGSTKEITINWPAYPDESKTVVAPSEIDISLKRNDGSIIQSATGTKLFDYSWIYGPIKYKADIKINDSLTTITSDSKDKTEKLDFTYGDKIEVCGYYAFQDLDIRSNTSCKTYVVDDNEQTLTIPNSNATKTEIENWANLYNIKIVFKDVPSDDKIGQTIIRKDGSEISGTITLKQSEIAKAEWECITFIEKDVDITITPESERDSEGRLILKANINKNGGTWSWKNCNESKNNECHVKTDKNTTVIANYRVNFKNYTKEYLVNSD